MAPMFVMLSLGGLFGKLTGFASKILPGPLGLAAGGISSLVSPRQTAIQRTPGVIGAAQRFFPGGATGFREVEIRGGGGGGKMPTQSQQARANAAATGLVCPPGERPNKSRYHLLNGTLVEPGTRCVKSRRIDVGNATALRRSIRRENGFAKLAKRALRGSRFKVTSASAGTRRGPRTIVESGPGSVVTR